MTVNIFLQMKGKSILVRVSEGSSYRESTVSLFISERMVYRS